MFKFSLCLLAVYHVGCVPLDSNAQVVDIDDDDTIQHGKTLKDIRSIITAGMKKSDPTILNHVVANLATLNYTLSNVNIRGLSKCILENAEINKKALTLNIQWTCPNFDIEGQYQTKGTLLILHLEGRGDFKVRIGKYNIITNANLEEFKDKNGQSHLKIKSFTLHSLDYLEPITFYMTNLFDGNERLASDPKEVDNNDSIEYEDETAKNIRNIITAGMEKSDPIILDRVNANLATLNYTVSNITVTGLAKCEVKNAEIDKKALILKLEWACPSFSYEGQYQTKGTILIIPIEGRGDFVIRTGKYNMITNVNLSELKDKSGRPHLKIKNFNLSHIKFTEPVTIQLTNLFNGDKGLAKETLKFINDNWKDVVDVIKDPVVNAWMKIALKNINEFLKSEPIDKILN